MSRLTPDDVPAAIAAVRASHADERSVVMVCYPSGVPNGSAPPILTDLCLEGIEDSVWDILRLPLAEQEASHGRAVALLEAFRRRSTPPTEDALWRISRTVAAWWCFEVAAGRAAASLVYPTVAAGIRAQPGTEITLALEPQPSRRTSPRPRR